MAIMAAPTTITTVKLSPDEAEAAISSFQSILRIPTVSSTAPTSGAYVACAQYILSQLQSIPCLASSSFLLEESKDSNYPVVIAKWEGVHPDWPVIILNSHYDVVPAILEDWTVDPFGAERRDGKVSSI
jgi:aminoacylase